MLKDKTGKKIEEGLVLKGQLKCSLCLNDPEDGDRTVLIKRGEFVTGEVVTVPLDEKLAVRVHNCLIMPWVSDLIPHTREIIQRRDTMSRTLKCDHCPFGNIDCSAGAFVECYEDENETTESMRRLPRGV